MYFWRTKQLARDLKTGVLSSREKLSYLLAWVTLIAMGMSSIEGAGLSTPDRVEDVLNVVCLVAFVVYCHWLNEKGDGREFIERLVCISWPEMMKFVPSCLMLAITVGIVERFTPRILWRIVSDGGGWLLLLFFFRRISLQIKWIAGAP